MLVNSPYLQGTFSIEHFFLQTRFAPLTQHTTLGGGTFIVENDSWRKEKFGGEAEASAGGQLAGRSVMEPVA